MKFTDYKIKEIKMKKLMIALLVLAVIAVEVSSAHAYTIKTIIKSNGIPWTGICK
jgi:DNA-binding PadR family transcriptional regulator